jgi:esterase
MVTDIRALDGSEQAGDRRGQRIRETLMRVDETDATEIQHLANVADIAGIPTVKIVLPEQRDAVLGGMRLHYLDWGGPEGEPILFLHGGGLSAHTWDIVCLALRDEHRCYALDLRGHGDSEWSPVVDYGLDAHLRDLEAFVETVGDHRFFLVGQSLGGILAIRYASRHVDRLAGLVLVDVGPFAGGEVGMDRIVEFTLGRHEFDSIDQAVDAAVAFNPKRNPRLLRYSLERNLRRLPDGRWTWKRDQRYLSRQWFSELVAQVRALVPEARTIACPTLIVRGADSDVFSAQEAAEFAAILEHGSWVTVEDAGHNVQGDNPSGLLNALRPFLSEHRSKSNVGGVKRE